MRLSAVCGRLDRTILEAINANDCKLMLKWNSKPDQHLEDTDTHLNGTALAWSAFSGRDSIVELLLKAGAEVNSFTRDGATPLFLAAHNGFSAVCVRLIAAGANVNHQTSDKGLTACMIAAQYGRLKDVKLLLGSGTEVNALSHEGWSALCFAASNGHAACVAELIGAGATGTVSPATADPLLLSAREGHVDCIKALLTLSTEKLSDGQDAIAAAKLLAAQPKQAKCGTLLEYHFSRTEHNTKPVPFK